MNFLRQILEILTAPIRLLLAAPRKMLDSSRRLSGLSLPARVAIATEVLLILIVIVAAVSFYFMKNRTPFWVAYPPAYCVVVVVLVIVIPFVLYKALQIWLEGEVSPYPDIDRAWKAGMEELERQGIDIRQIPLFLILGSSSLRQEKALFDAARVELGIREIPNGTAPIHWYAGPNGVFLVCSALGCQSRIAALGAEAMSSDRGYAAPRSDPRGTMMMGGQGARGTMVGPSARETAPPSSKPSIVGTMMIGGRDSGIMGGGAPAVDPSRVIKLGAAEITTEERRLSYLARLIRRARQPICPVNGILNLVPYGVIQRGDPDADAVKRATHSDLNSLHRVLMLRCSVTALVTGIEEESGFRELVRRVGRDKARDSRFGKGFSEDNEPLGERLEALAIHACGAFEDWIYHLFREADALSKPGNTKLYSLLCKIRHKVQDRLKNILTGGYSCDPDDQPLPEALRFGGCYFGGTGEGEERQAFVAAAVNKWWTEPRGETDKIQDKLEWTDDKLRQEDRIHFASQLVLVLDLLLIVALAAEVYFWFWKPGSGTGL